LVLNVVHSRVAAGVQSRMPATGHKRGTKHLYHYLEKNSMENSSEITIVDVKMPFISMVVFMVKAAVAAIPAVIILALIFAILGAMFGGIFGGMGIN
jgi:hypothetical protein